MRFDAYAGNAYGGATAGQVAELVAIGAGGRALRGRPRGRYNDCFDVLEGADSIGWVGWDGVLEAAYFEVKGARTPAAAAAIRKHLPEQHGVSRVDACEDFDDEGAFAKLVALVDRTAAEPRLKSHAWQPRNDPDAGATVYWGSTKSKVMVRVYEKGKEPENRAAGRPNWARVEAQVRPGKAAEKRLAASLTPMQAWGFASWSARVGEAIGQVEVPRCFVEATPSTHDRTTLYLARAFRRHFEQLLLDFGSWECVGREIAQIWAEDDLAKRGMGR